MANVARAIEQAASCKVDETLWWDSHESLFQLLDDFFSGSRKLSPNLVAKKIQANYRWLLESLLRFKRPNAKSSSALDVAHVDIGDFKLDIKFVLKSLALDVSKKLVLDEVQSYILVSRCFSDDESLVSSPELFQKVMLKYFMERQCLLKSIRLLLLYQVAETSANHHFEEIDREVSSLVKERIDEKLFSVLDGLFRVEQPLDMDMMYINLWAEEIVMEEHLVLDIMFLLYFDPSCFCSFSRWKELYALFKDRVFVGTNVERLSLTTEAGSLIEHVKHQCVLIILEGLELDKLLLMVYEDAPFSQGRHPFACSDLLQQIYRLIGGVNALEVKEYAPLLLGLGAFCCLVSFLPMADSGILDSNHTYYIHQAYEAGAFKYIKNMLCHRGMKETLVDGYKYVVRSMMSTFVAAYDISSQSDTTVVEDVIDILSLIYSGQETLCTEFWDRENILDAPLRNLLCSLRKYFPYKMKTLVHFLTGLAGGQWAAECVYDFLYKESDIICVYQNTGEISDDKQSITATVDLLVPDVPGLLIPAGTVGETLQILEDNKRLVLWKCKHSAIVLLLLRLVHLTAIQDSWAEVDAIVHLLDRMLSCSKKIAEAFLKLNRSDICQGAHSDGRMSMTVSVDILVVLCLLLDKLLDVLDHNATAALCIQVLGTFVECCPQRVMLELQKPSSSWSSNSLENCLLTKLLSKICQDSERFMGRHLLVINVVDLCKPLVSKGVYSEGLCKMVMYIIGPLFLNHMTWKYEEKHEHWEITAKVFELSTIIVSNPDVSFIPLKAKVLGFLMNDGAFHSVLGRILSVNMTDMHGLYFNRFVEPLEIESFEEAVTKGFLLLHKCISSYFASITDIHSTSSPLEFMLLHHAPGATPLIGCVVSLTGYSKNEALQLAAIKMLTTLCIISGKARPHPLTISSYIQGDEQKESLQKLVEISLSKQSAEANIELYFHVIELMETAAKYQPSFLVMLLVPVKSPQTLEKQPHNLSAPENVCPSSTIEKLIWPILSQNCDYERQLEVVSRLLSLLKLLWEGGGEFSDILELLQKHVGFWTALTSYISNVRDNFTGLELSNHGFRYRCQTYALEIIAWELFLEREQIVYKTSCDDGKNVKEELKAGVKSALIQLLQAKDFVKVMQSLAVPQYDKSVITRAKAELKVMLVGLMMKVLKDDELGLSVSMFEFVREALKSVFCHSSFQKLVSTYLSQGYGHGQELYSLVISDLFFHLHGQLEAGRHIPGRLFEDLAQYLNTFDIGAVYRSETIYSEGSAYKESFVYDTQLLSQHLGLEWWEQTAAHFVQTASGALKAMDEANIMLSLGSCQIRVLNALQSIFSLLVSSNQMSFAGLESHAKDMYIISICESIESAFQLLLPEGDFTSYMQCFISAQLALLLVLLQWLSNSARADKVNIHVARLCSRVVVTLARAVRPISSLLVPENVVQQELIKNLLGAYLICLEILQAHKDTGEMQYSDSDNGNDLDHSTACDVTSTNVEFLQFMCLLIGNRCHTSVAISVLCVLMKHFLVPRIWIPIFQAHSTVGHALALLHLTKDTEIAFQVLNLLLCFSCVRSGVEMLQSAGAFSNILMFTENLNQDLMDTEIHAPFSAWKGRTRKHELWALALAVVAAFVQAIGENTGEQALDSAFAFLDSQKQHMLNALLSPGFSNLDRGKITRYGRSETTISALQETHQALHVLVLLVRYHTQWSHVMGSLEMDLQHKCIHLLAYIAREGLSRNVSASMRPSFFCYPITKDEFHSQLSVSSLNTTEGWFGVSAKGVCIRSILSGFNTSTDAGQSLILVSSAQAQSDVVPTAYSDSIALHVYKICLLLLELLCKQAHRAVIILNEGGPQNQISFPEFPAPEILHALEDQIVSVLKDLCGEKMRTTNKLLQSTCWLLLSILEKSLFIEALLSRMCGLGSLSVRSEDFWKDYKTLLSACAGHDSLESSVKTLKTAVSLAYPSIS